MPDRECSVVRHRHHQPATIGRTLRETERAPHTFGINHRAHLITQATRLRIEIDSAQAIHHLGCTIGLGAAHGATEVDRATISSKRGECLLILHTTDRLVIAHRTLLKINHYQIARTIIDLHTFARIEVENRHDIGRREDTITTSALDLAIDRATRRMRSRGIDFAHLAIVRVDRTSTLTAHVHKIRRTLGSIRRVAVHTRAVGRDIIAQQSLVEVLHITLHDLQLVPNLVCRLDQSIAQIVIDLVLRYGPRKAAPTAMFIVAKRREVDQQFITTLGIEHFAPLALVESHCRATTLERPIPFALDKQFDMLHRVDLEIERCDVVRDRYVGVVGMHRRQLGALAITRRSFTASDHHNQHQYVD